MFYGCAVKDWSVDVIRLVWTLSTCTEPSYNCPWTQPIITDLYQEFPSSFQFWTAFLRFDFAHTSKHSRILQFHLLNECSSNRISKPARNSKAKKKENHHERFKEMRSTYEANKVYFRFCFKKSLCIERKSFERVSNLEFKLIAISWMTWWAFSFISFHFIYAYQIKIMIHSDNFIMQTTTTTIHSSRLLQPISFQMTSYYAFINFV